jgi:uncharacterized membrane protein
MSSSSPMAQRVRQRQLARSRDEQQRGTHLPENISETERWISLGAGSLLLLSGLTRFNMRGLLLGLMGGGLIQRGLTGHCYAYEALGMNTSERKPSTAVPAQQGIKLEKSIHVGRPAEELYHFWRDFENLPRIMPYLESVEVIDDQRSHWVAQGVGGATVEWDAEIINERPSEMIAWRSLPGGDIETAGSVHFKSLPGETGTDVVVSMKYNPPGGKLAANLAEFMGVGAIEKIEESLQRFKDLMEASHISMTENRRF